MDNPSVAPPKRCTVTPSLKPLEREQLRAEVDARALKAAIFVAVTCAERICWRDGIDALADLHAQAARHVESIERQG